MTCTALKKKEYIMATAAIPDSYEIISGVSPLDQGIVNVDRSGPVPSPRGLKFRRPGFLAFAALIVVLSAQLAVAQESVLYSFSFNKTGTDGAAPVGNLLFDTAGNLYGATSSGGSTYDAGMIYELSPKAGGGWTENILYAFTGQADGGAPNGSLIFDADGNLYGTAGGGSHAQGVVFELSPQTGGVWTEQVLYTFNGETDGNAPQSGLSFDKSGNLYGTTESGGENAAYGTVFELSPQSGGVWTEQILHSFNSNFVDGYRPLGSLVFDAAGDLYGTTSYGGANALGTVFELTPGTGGVWAEKIIFSLGYGNTPYANLIFDTPGNLYSTTFFGGAKNSTALNGTVFELSPQTGGTWTQQILHSFAEDSTDGGSLAAGLIADANGNLYSTTFHGGPYYTQNDTSNTDGTIFELLPQQSGGWVEQVLYFFGSATNDGVLPAAGVIADAQGNLYGETGEGGAYGYGAVYEYKPVPTAALPVISPNSGTYASAPTVTITDPSTTIHYTTDGSTPTASSPVYTGWFPVSTTETVQAIAVSTGVANSPVAYATYTIESPAETPSISPAGGTYTTTEPVFIYDATVGAEIYYSTNGGTPGTLYSGTPIFVTSSETIKAMAVATGYTDSAVASATFTIQTPAAITSPAQNSTFTGSSVTFDWTTAAGATGYYLWIGSTGVGSNNIYNSAPKTVTSYTFNSMPMNGETIYVRLTTNYSGTWVHKDYTYTAAAQAAMTAPAQGATFAGPSVAFTWSAAAVATGYYLLIGSTGVGSNNIYNSAEKTVTGYTFTHMPTNGEAIYVRLITNYSGTWVHNDYAYTAATQAVLTTPTQGSTLAGPSVTFDWSAAASATGYYLWIGSTGVGSNNLYNSAEKTVISYTFTHLPTNGETIYVRLITNYSGTWVYNDYTYTASAQAAMTNPASGSTFTGSSVSFTWSAASGATGYYLQIGSTGVGSDDIYNSAEKTVTSYTFTHMPTNGETVYIRLITNYSGTWVHNDYTYEASPSQP
jgi:uncharacterized repeat protein (TIGR03803 family)